MSKINPVTQEIIEYEEMNHLYDNIHKYIYDQGYSILDKNILVILFIIKNDNIFIFISLII